jgi:SRSO17 transposase
VPGPADRLRAGHRLRPPRPHPSRPDPRRRPRHRAAPLRLAVDVGRAGPKGQRYYDWAWITLTPDSAAVGCADGTESGCWWLLVRRHRRTGELAFYRCYSPQIVPLRELVRVAGRRWTIEETFQTGKGLAGLDEHQVRRWTSWQR